MPPLSTANGMLPASATPIVGTLLAVSDPWRAHPGLDELRAECTVESRDTFAWEAYERACDVSVLGHLGADGSARRLDVELGSKRGSLSIAQRFAGFAALDRIDTPLARMLLLGYALGSPWPDRTAHIASLFATRAGLRGVANEIREEEFFPAIPVALALDFGPRELSVGYDDQLAVHLVDAAGARLPKMPKPTKKDDPAKVAVALAHYEAFTTDLASLRATALVWLERAMAEERAWSLARFRAGIVAHEALRRLARGLVWRASWAGKATHVRIAEDGTFADASDAGSELPEEAVLGVTHPATMDAAERDAFARSLGDYEVIQPFEQLARAVFRLTDEEAATTSLARYAGVVVATAKREKLLGARGWQESARSTTFLKKVNAGHVVLRLDAQSVHRHGETAADRLGTVTLVGPEGDLPLGRLGAIEASELVRDLEEIRLG